MATALSVMEPTWETIDGSDFLIKPLDGKDMLRVSDVVKIEGNSVLLTADACVVLLRHGLVGWRNFADAEGNQVLFTNNQEDNLARIPFNIVRSLAVAILARSNVGAEDEKN